MAIPAARARIAPPAFSPFAALVAGTLTDAVLDEEVEVEDLVGEWVLVAEPEETVPLLAPVETVRVAAAVAVPEAEVIVVTVTPEADAVVGTALMGDEMTN